MEHADVKIMSKMVSADLIQTNRDDWVVQDVGEQAKF